MPTKTAIISMFCWGLIPVFGSLGTVPTGGANRGATTTVAVEVSVAVKLLALPIAVAVFVVVAVKVVWQVYTQVSETSKRLLALESPDGLDNGVHLLSVTLTLFNATVPGLVTL